MLSKLLIFICAFIALGVLYASWTYGSEYSTWLIPTVVVGSVVIVLAPQIDWWWLMRNPPKTDLQIIKMLELKMPLFRESSPPIKKFLLHRIELFMNAFDWMPQGFETIPADAKYVLCSYAAQLTHLREKFLFKYWEKVIFYKHPFPSPQFPKHIHNSEIFVEDNVMLFSIEALIAGFLDPYTHFPVGLYEIARVYGHSFKVNFTDAISGLSESDFEKISGKPWSWIHDGLGLDSVDPDGVAVVCFYLYPQEMEQVVPIVFERCAKEFGKHSTTLRHGYL